MQLKLHKPTVVIACVHKMSILPIQVEVTNVFRSKPIAEAEMSNRLIINMSYFPMASGACKSL